MENVANFVSNAHIGTFKAWYSLVENLGYNNFAQVLNATSYGIPQNRERIFLVSIRKDISDKYHFPQPIKLEKRFKDVLESNVDEKYYLSQKGVEYISKRHGGYCKINGEASATLTRNGIENWTGSFVSVPFNDQNGVARTIKKQYANVGGANMVKNDSFGASGVIDIAEPIICAMRGRNPENPSERGKSNGRYKQRLEPNITGCANAITSVQKDCLVAEPQVMQVGNIVDDTNIGFKNPQRGRIYSADGLSPTLNCCKGGGLEPKIVEGEIKSNNLLELVQTGLVRIRKITPREAFRLMDLEESDIDTLLSSGLANTSLYQLAGNSICVGVLYHLFRKMFVETENESEQMTLF